MCIRDSDYTICYNGEIYNTDELIPELSENGFVCSTTSDTEVILYAYIHWGADFVNRLNGIFAFAIWVSNRFFMPSEGILWCLAPSQRPALRTQQ